MLEWGRLDEERTPFCYYFSKHGFACAAAYRRHGAMWNAFAFAQAF